MKRVVILGSTGSIGASALDVIQAHPDRFKVVGLSAHRNVERVRQQAVACGTELIAVTRTAQTAGDIISGPDAAQELVRRTRPDIVLNGIAGAAGFLPSLTVVSLGITLALANKESMVVGGAFIKAEAKRTGAQIIPVDSEHSAIFQCLQGERPEDIERIVLTASGGPFRERPFETFASITPDEALKHPVWTMGQRITIDSATMMNKALEIIEAHWLFDVPVDRIDVCIHPQSIVHSMVEFKDTSIKAQMGNPDMRVPIAYALAWPERIGLRLPRFDFAAGFKLDFMPPEGDKFRALVIARHAMTRPETHPCIMNAADEVAISAFLARRIAFNKIMDLIEKTIEKLKDEEITGPDDLLALDRKARIVAEGLIT
jgi:1-deoxy-D-xylulose-5-phosphate reductoisomerase